jgi:hypothetical protein
MLDHPTTAITPLRDQLEASTSVRAEHIRGTYSLQPADRQRLVLGVEHVLRLGPRVTAELLIETSDDVPHLLLRLDDLRRLTPEVAEALGVDRWTAPLRPGRRRAA